MFSSSIIQNVCNKYGFKSISISDRDTFCHRKNIRIADISFTSFFAWEKTFNNVYKDIFGYTCVIFIDTDNSLRCYIDLAGYCAGTFNNVLDFLYKVFEGEGQPLIISFVQEEYIKIFNSTDGDYSFKVRHDPDYGDYIYKYSDFYNFDGAENRHRRQQLNHFTNRYEFNAVSIGAKHHDICIEIFKKWQFNKSNNDMLNEEDALRAVLKNYDMLGNYGCLLYVNGEPVSFAIGEMINPSSFVYYFQKSSVGFKGLNLCLYLEFSRFHPICKYINFTEDMGIAGLRSYKRNLCTYAMENKYNVLVGKR